MQNRKLCKLILVQKEISKVYNSEFLSLLLATYWSNASFIGPQCIYPRIFPFHCRSASFSIIKDGSNSTDIIIIISDFEVLYIVIIVLISSRIFYSNIL